MPESDTGLIKNKNTLFSSQSLRRAAEREKIILCCVAANPQMTKFLFAAMQQTTK
jgi:hypothetical protein